MRDPCEQYWPPKLDVPPQKGSGPSPQPQHLPKSKNPATGRSYWTDYRDWARLPNAPYPPGGTPSGGAQELSISSEEWARLARKSPYYKCQFAQQVQEASRLKFNWMLWVGLGAGALGLGMLVVMKR